MAGGGNLTFLCREFLVNTQPDPKCIFIWEILNKNAAGGGNSDFFTEPETENGNLLN